MTLAQAIDRRLRQAALMGNRLSRRRHVEIDMDGNATLRLGWVNDAGIAPVQDGDTPDLDLTDLPRGVDVREWRAPDDTVDALDPAPTEADIRDAAARLGCKWVDRLDCEDCTTVYAMVVT